MEFQGFEEGQVGENGGQLDEYGFEVDIPVVGGSGGMRSSCVI